MLGRLERGRRTRPMLRRGFKPPYSEIVLRSRRAADGPLRPGQACPAVLTRQVQRYFGPDGLLRADAFARFESFLSDAARVDHNLRCYDDVLAFVAEVRDRRARREARIGAAFPGGVWDTGAAASAPSRPVQAISARGRCSRPAPGAASLATRWGLARPSRRWPPPRSWPASSAWNACSSCARRR